MWEPEMTLPGIEGGEGLLDVLPAADVDTEGILTSALWGTG